MTVDFQPLFRSAIGFDRMARLLDTARTTADVPSYPPYNIEKTGEDTYVLTMAVAGFASDDLDISAQDNTLVISGRLPEDKGQHRYLHRGIAGRAFERRFVLADHMTVSGAELVNGLLHVSLRRVVPEALKPRRIQIASAAPQAPRVLEAEPAQQAA
ncbi:molecular chaperone IbpA [Humitalea rosea]|uniref:Molecular chaperone IbpA n=1 Tax=Humitalea rosea TaxID=990373 RepID=A0A2W7IL82_9PROT|nr:Hsp20 family protein [Humitalea rosea]PZW46757.1 molecular chaperone IbpA [Humitalea rosea]